MKLSAEIKSFVLFVLIIIPAYCQDFDVYTNPVIPGDWSDPGVVRVGDNFYSVRSTFGWIPGLQIAHSKDLVHWEYIGFADENNAFTIPDGITNPGIWGSDIGYDSVNKTFLVYAPANNTIRVYHSKSPSGPYTDGGIVTDGYDPGFFIDDDGKMYLTKTGGSIYRLSADGLRIEGGVIARVTSGEGPEIFKHNGYYYYLISPGGTRPYQHHKIMSYRAENLEGPWEQDPNNPVMYAPHTTGAKLQGPGHGEVFQTQHGDWYLTYHAYELSHYSLGRTTCLEPVIWTAGGWWKPINGKIPSEHNSFPRLTPDPRKMKDSDEFDTEELGKQWFFHTLPDYSGQAWTLRENPGCLRIKTRKGDISSPEVRNGLFLQRVTQKKFDITSKVTFDAAENGDAAGIHLYHDPNRNIWLTTTRVDGEKVFEVGCYDRPFPSDEDPGPMQPAEIAEIMDSAVTIKKIVARVDNTVGNTVHLKMSIDGEENVSFAYSANGVAWILIDARLYFGDSWHYSLRGQKPGAPDLGWVGVGKANVWTGTVMGIFACSGISDNSKNADFHNFMIDSTGSVGTKFSKPEKRINPSFRFNGKVLEILNPSPEQYHVDVLTLNGKRVLRLKGKKKYLLTELVGKSGAYLIRFSFSNTCHSGKIVLLPQ